MQKKDAFYCYAAVAAWCLLWRKRMSVTSVESRSHDNVKQAVLVPPQYAPAPASGDFNSHPELSAWKVWYGILEFNVPLDTVQAISETGGPEQ